MPLFTALIASLSLTGASTDVHSVDWGANAAPTGPEAGSVSYCMLWAGRTRPNMFNISLYDPSVERFAHGQPELLMAAPWLDGRRNGSVIETRIDMPGGVVMTRLGQYYEAGPHMTITRLSSLDEVLAGLSQPGEISITMGGQTVRYAVPELTAALDRFRACVAQLPPAAQ
ncbi:hypothetical protein F1654_05035 [Alkalicaulis satelles]|uniref:Invasion associated locus B family protein n=1 Tax=Alkalicaulis satelles TaxID=2609175 RepID=A0A5M6ZN57_9PROT|nr:hypothetical protein [Alkalicaulis satelles]KAA5805345.1 hypothetical protein F1654_05035 [Alkalicaulis satelles]